VRRMGFRVTAFARREKCSLLVECAVLRGFVCRLESCIIVSRPAGHLFLHAIMSSGGEEYERTPTGSG
jgi:hypothetical protein